LQLANRIIGDEGGALSDIRTRAAGDALLTQLVLRSYSLSDDPAQRRELLDVVERLLDVAPTESPKRSTSCGADQRLRRFPARDLADRFRAPVMRQ
jgi:hypothetical protein